MSTSLEPKIPGSVLDKIADQRRLDVTEAQARVTADELRSKIATQSPAGDFVAALQAAPMAILAEMKRASPSKGDIAMHVDAAQQGLTYALAGACTISVLTEPTWFKGSLDDLRRVKVALEDAKLSPGTCVLRKDFIIDEYQLLEARAHGADTALLIVAILSPTRLVELMAASRALGMEPLVEVATEGEMAVALQAKARVIGVNNRNLHTMEVDMGRTRKLAGLIPRGGVETPPLLLALSGVSSRSDVEGFAADAAVGCLVGESLMRAASPAALIRELLGLPPPHALCKICGLRTAEAALAATQAGADLLGMIFVPGTKRNVTEEEAAHMVREVRKLRPRAADWQPPRFPFREAGDHAEDEGEEGAARWLQLWRGLLARGAQAGGPLTVGVFVDASAEEINGIAERVGLDLVQLHGKSEGWEIARQLRVPAVRVVHMAEGVSAAQVLGQLRGGSCAAVLLDSKGGGTGQTFDWEVGVEVQAKAPFILAGGLTPDNVTAAVKQVRPWCVDVSSGVETDGAKDVGKIQAFVRNANQ
mmetsp:Transcript_25224/g.51243  ORF Transcript_25224/g.51243 Transcript_25224/m.51243 type:complete len:534 (-) Transcript_25224:236-1837(-)